MANQMEDDILPINIRVMKTYICTTCGWYSDEEKKCPTCNGKEGEEKPAVLSAHVSDGIGAKGNY